MRSFAAVLADFQQRSGRSQRTVARAADLDPGRYSRLLRGEGEPSSRQQVLALAAALELNRREIDRLVAAAGFLPPSLEAIGPDDPAVAAVVEALTAPELDEPARAALRRVIVDIAGHWRARRVMHDA